MEALRSLAMEFLAKIRAEVDRVVFFGLGLKISASRDIRKMMAQVFSGLGLKPKPILGFNLKGRRKSKCLSTSGLKLRPRPLDAVSRVKSNASGQGEASSEKAPVMSAVESSCLAFSGDDTITGSVAGFDEAVSAALSGKVANSSPAKSVLHHGFLRPVSSSTPDEESVLALGAAESSSIREVSSVSDEVALEKDPDLEPVMGGGLFDEQREDCNRVFLEMFSDSASCLQGFVPNIPMESSLTIPQWWLLEWLRGQVKHGEAQLAYLMGVEEEACQLNKVAIPLGAVKGFDLM